MSAPPSQRPPELVLTGSTLGNPPFPDLAAAASAAGFDGLSIWPEHDYQRAREQGLSDRGLRALLDDHGLVVHDVDCAVVWAGDGDPGPPYFEEPGLDLLLRAAEVLEARYANVLLIGRRSASVDDAAESLARLCDRLADAGLTATVELSAGTAAPDLATAARIVTACGRSNAGLMVDAWHVHWGAATLEEISAASREMILGVQLNDAPAQRPADLAHATRYERLPPGEGAADLIGLLRAVGSERPLTVEVFNQPLVDRHGTHAVARRMADRVRALKEAAHG